MSLDTLKFSASAKINLYLHITGTRDDGYHTLESLMCFCDLEDVITLMPAGETTLSVGGEFAKELSSEEVDDNLISKALKVLQQYSDKPLQYKIELEKNIPLGAGLGGGSADAAAVIRAVTNGLGLGIAPEMLDDILLSLGADVPVCYRNAPCIVRGIGEEIVPVKMTQKLYGVLVNPNAHCSTVEIFKNYDSDFTKQNSSISDIAKFDNLISFLKAQNNDLENVAIKMHSVIEKVLQEISTQDNCALSRMSGSGSTCFGLFESEQDAETAEQKLKTANPEWWVRKIVFN